MFAQRLLALGAAAIVVALPQTAQARFGKRSNHPTDSSESSSKTTPPGEAHPAAPANAPSPEGGEQAGARAAGTYRPHHQYQPAMVVYDDYYYGWGYGYYPYFWAPGPPPAAPMEEAQSSPPTTTLGMEGQIHNQHGTTLGVYGAVEGERFGFNIAFAGIFAPSDTADQPMDVIKLLDAHLTWALIAGAHGRLRVEAGVDAAFGQDVVFVGPDGGASAALGVLGPLGLEASAHVTPYPHIKVDGLAGPTLALGPLGLRAGWKVIYLDDRGKIPGDVRHTDTFSGPYAGLALAF